MAAIADPALMAGLRAELWRRAGSKSTAVLAAITEKEKTITQLERQLEVTPVKRAEVPVGDVERWVKGQFTHLAALLKSDVPKVAEFRRLNLALTFTPTEAFPRHHFIVTGQCDLSALVCLYGQPIDRAFPLDWVRLWA